MATTRHLRGKKGKPKRRDSIPKVRTRGMRFGVKGEILLSMKGKGSVKERKVEFGALADDASLLDMAAEKVKQVVSYYQEVNVRYASLKGERKSSLPEAEAQALKYALAESNVKGDEGNAISESAEAYANLLNQGLTVLEAAKVLGGVNPSRIRQRLTSSPPTLYGIKAGSEWVLPRFQFDERGEIDGMGEVISVLDPSLHPLAVDRWFRTPNPDLEPEESDTPLSPRDWLRTGHKVEEVSRIAEAL